MGPGARRANRLQDITTIEVIVFGNVFEDARNLESPKKSR